MKSNCCKPLIETEPGVTVRVDVAQIVKYVCLSGVLIVGIIFGTRCLTNIIKEKKTKENN